MADPMAQSVSEVLPKMPVGIQEDGIRVNTLIGSADEAERIIGLINALVPFISKKTPQPKEQSFISGAEEFEEDQDDLG